MNMRKLAIAAALASTMLATPALARDGSAYVGLEGGGMIVEDYEADFRGDLDVPLTPEFEGHAVDIDHNVGWDIDLVAGYDFGVVRLEGELGYKHASLDGITASKTLIGAPTEGPFD